MTTLREALQQETQMRADHLMAPSHPVGEYCPLCASNSELDPPSYVVRHEMSILKERIKRLELQVEGLKRDVALATNSQID